MIRELNVSEKSSLFEYMMTLDEFGGFDAEELTGDHAKDFDSVTGECTLRHVICESSDTFLTVGLFWNGGNHLINIFQGSRIPAVNGGGIKWEITAFTPCNNAAEYATYKRNEHLGDTTW